MGTIDDIIKVIDEELINNRKSYLTLTQSNRLLLKEYQLTISEYSNHVLKKLLVENKIPHAYQTENKPKQWRIPLSKKGLLRKKNKSNSINITKKNNTYESFQNMNTDSNIVICPSCGLHIAITRDLVNQKYIRCSNCLKRIDRTINYPLPTGNTETPFKQQPDGFLEILFGKQPSLGTQIFRGILVGAILLGLMKTCEQTPEESMKQYQKEQKYLREHEKKKQETKEYFEFMGGQE